MGNSTMSRWFNQEARVAWNDAGDEALKRLEARDTKDKTQFVTSILPALRELFKNNNDLVDVRE
jgi:hypothetical protein